jgi:uncharacterized protein with NAD-binding domain and iron-sulfur cluster
MTIVFDAALEGWTLDNQGLIFWLVLGPYRHRYRGIMRKVTSSLGSNMYWQWHLNVRNDKVTEAWAEQVGVDVFKLEHNCITPYCFGCVLYLWFQMLPIRTQ